MIITGATPTRIYSDTFYGLNDGTGLTFPKIYEYDGYLFTHSAKYIILLDLKGQELYRDQILPVINRGAEHTYFDRFDTFISNGYGNYIITKYFNSKNNSNS